jgi:glycosyltransferase involved in cell wall biosynthesis
VESGIIRYLPHQNDISTLITGHELVILPSYREGTPRTLLEAAALGRVILASDVPGCREVINHEVNGFLFEVRNSKSIVQAIYAYMKLSNEEKIQMSLASRTLVERKFDEKFVIDHYRKVIDGLL